MKVKVSAEAQAWAGRWRGPTACQHGTHSESGDERETRDCGNRPPWRPLWRGRRKDQRIPRSEERPDQAPTDGQANRTPRRTAATRPDERLGHADERSDHARTNGGSHPEEPSDHARTNGRTTPRRTAETRPERPLKREGAAPNGGKGAAAATLDWGESLVRCIRTRGPVRSSLPARNIGTNHSSEFSVIYD